ncbi:hypothetical protein [Clostridium sp. UBA3887]|uniref:hypothetical protein n=1 Tax=Clostridium sp. UBA3887 TaxID=1946356 RepID=UPI003217CFE7
MTEKELKILNTIKQLKIEYPFFYKIFKWISIFIVLTPVFIWLSYRIGHYYVLIPTDTSEGELLAFYGTILSFISILGLGALALWQNIKANNINNRLSLIEQKRFKLDLQPFVVVTGWDFKRKITAAILHNPPIICFEIIRMEKNDLFCAFVTLEFTNTSSTYIMMNYLEGRMYYNGNFIETLKNCSCNLYDTTLYLESGKKGKMGFYLPITKINEIRQKTLKLDFTLKNRFNDIYKETIEIGIPVIHEMDNENNWHVVMYTQNYKIKKFNSETNKYEDD